MASTTNPDTTTTTTPSDDDINFPITPCTPADIPSLIAVYDSAFSQDPINALLYPPTLTKAAKHAFLTHRFQNQMELPEIRSFKITDAATGEVAAYVRWGYPHVLSGAEKEARRVKKETDEREGRGSFDGLNEVLFREKFGLLEVMREKWVKWDETYVCHLMVVSQHYQRRGFARRLITHVLNIADAEGRPSYIEATHAGHPAYLKMGFKDIDEFACDLSPWGGASAVVNKVMRREPPVKGGVR